MRGHDEHVFVGACSFFCTVTGVHAVVGAVLQRQTHWRSAVIKQRNTLTLDRNAKAVDLARGDRSCSSFDDLWCEVIERSALVVGAPTAPVICAHVSSPGRSVCQFLKGTTPAASLPPESIRRVREGFRCEAVRSASNLPKSACRHKADASRRRQNRQRPSLLRPLGRAK